MRTAMILFLCFCSVLGGWTASLARIQHEQAVTHASSDARHQDHAAAPVPASGSDCCAGHQGSGKDQSHPKLCPVCFAIEATMTASAARNLQPWRPHPESPVVLALRMPKPLFPPPKA